MRKFRFIGTKHQAVGYMYDTPQIGGVYDGDDNLGGYSDVRVKTFASLYPSEWEEVVEEALGDTTQKMYTLDEVVEVVNNWGICTVVASDIAGFFAREEKASKLRKIKELEEEINKIKETL